MPGRACRLFMTRQFVGEVAQRPGIAGRLTRLCERLGGHSPRFRCRTSGATAEAIAWPERRCKPASRMAASARGNALANRNGFQAHATHARNFPDTGHPARTRPAPLEFSRCERCLQCLSVPNDRLAGRKYTIHSCILRQVPDRPPEPISQVAPGRVAIQSRPHSRWFWPTRLGLRTGTTEIPA